jgi:3-carboxy-cis,cis-muconate cycloisomerase
VGNPAAPLVRALRARVGDPAAGDVHRGATSQDIVDSASMLVARRALEPLLDDLGGAAAAAARLAGEHRATVMAGRTLLQQAVPVTFGLKAAGWLVGLDEAAQRLDAVRRTRLAAQLGGAAGTLAAMGDAGIDVLARFARELELVEPVLAWHTTRTRVAELAAALGVCSGAVAKVAGDVVLLAQTEVAEVREGGERDRGGSSAMPHKHNPVAAISALAGARQAPGLVANLLGAMEHEHERAAGAWHAEWAPLRELLRSTGSAAAWLRDCLEGLEVDPERMRANLDGALLAERVAGAIGRPDADDIVRDALAAGRPLADVAGEHLDEEEAARVLDPTTYLGATDQLIDRALSAHARRS